VSWQLNGDKQRGICRGRAGTAQKRRYTFFAIEEGGVLGMALESFMYGYIVKEEVFPDQATIIEEGKYGDWVYVIMAGRVKTKKRTSKGMFTIDTLGEGAVVGEVPFLKKTDRLRTASIIADGQVKLGLLDKERLEKEYEALSPQLKSLIRTIAVRLDETTKRVSLLAAD
jgi:CRP-like cAMP-binding protein